MSQRKTWSAAQDQLLKELMQHEGNVQANKYKWGEIAQIINRNGNHRTGKQCRERWHNQLKPGIDNEREWTKQQQQILFQGQQSQGNKWAAIAKLLPGRTDNNIKNYFYSTLRKALRKVNNYIFFHKKEEKYKNVKQLKQQTLNKVLSVAEQKYQNKINLKRSTALEDARDIKKKLIAIQRDDDLIPSEEYSQILVSTIDKILEFNRNCKRRKGKKKDSQIDYGQSQENIDQQIDDQDSVDNQQKLKFKVQQPAIYNEGIKNKTKNQKMIEGIDIKSNKKAFQNKKQVIQFSKPLQIQKKDSSLLSSNNFLKQSIVILSHSSSSKQKNSALNISQSFPKPYFLQEGTPLFNHFHLINTEPSDFLSKLPVMQKNQTIKSCGMSQLWREDNNMHTLTGLNPFQISQSYMPPMNDNNMMASLNASGFLQKIKSQKPQRAESEMNP